MTDGRYKHRDLWLVMIGVFLTLAGGTPLGLRGMQQSAPVAHTHLWPNAFIAGAVIVCAAGSTYCWL